MEEDEQQKEILKIQEKLLSLAKQRTNLAKQRTDASEFRTYLNIERTLSVWIRTSLSIMVFGIAIDRFGHLMKHQADHPDLLSASEQIPTSPLGLSLVIFSVIMAFLAGWQFLVFAKKYKKESVLPRQRLIWLPPTYAFMIVIFGSILAFFMWRIN